MASLQMRYYHCLNGNPLLLSQTIINIGHTSAILVKLLSKLKLWVKIYFCTGDIETVDYCMEVYRQYLNNEPLDFFISGRWEIELVLQKMECELYRFRDALERLFT